MRIRLKEQENSDDECNHKCINERHLANNWTVFAPSLPATLYDQGPLDLYRAEVATLCHLPFSGLAMNRRRVHFNVESFRDEKRSRGNPKDDQQRRYYSHLENALNILVAQRRTVIINSERIKVKVNKMHLVGLQKLHIWQSQKRSKQRKKGRQRGRRWWRSRNGQVLGGRHFVPLTTITQYLGL